MEQAVEVKKEEKPEEKAMGIEQPAVQPAAPAVNAQEPKAEEKKELKQKKQEDKKQVVLERIYSIPLIKAYKKTETKRGDYAVSLLRQFVTRHVKASSVKIDNKVNSLIKQRGNTRPPKKIKVKVSKDKENTAMVVLA